MNRSSKPGRAARNLLIATASALAVMATASAAGAQGRTHAYDIPAGDAVTALQTFAKQSGKQILFPYDAASGHRTPAVRGQLSEGEALRRLADSAGLQVSSDDGRTITLVPAPARPQTTGGAGEPDSVVAVEEVIVTANRRAQKLVDVPMSVSAVTQADIEHRGIESLVDLSRSVPGLVVVESGPGQNRIFMRGVANGNSSTSLVGVYVDEMPVTGASLGQLDLRLVDLDRVEVLRGPQGTLYGQGSAGGAVRFITNSPDLQAFSGRIDAEAYGTAHGSGSTELTGVLNIPVVKDVFGLRLSGTFADIGGWIDQPAAGRKDINNQDLRNLRVKALLQPSENLKIEGTFVVHRNDGDGITAGANADQEVFFPTGDPLAQETMHDDYNLYNATVTYDFGGVSLLSSTSYNKSEKHVAGISVQVPGFETFNEDFQHNKVFTQEVRLSSSGHGKLSWVLGGFYDNETLDRLLILNLYGNGVFEGVVPLPTIDTSKSWSAFGDASYAVTPRLDLGAGIRYFHDERGETAGGLDLHNTFTSVDPRFYGSFALTPDVKLYANVAKGFRSGGFAGDTTARPFGPEDVWSYEAGIKGSTLGRIHWELTGFFSSYKNIQTFALTTPILGGLVNSGTAHIHGVDWLIAYDPIEALTLELSGNVTKAEMVAVLPSSQANIVGDRVDFVPDYAVSASAEYRFTWAEGWGGFIRADYNQIGPSTLTDHSSGVVALPTDTLHMLNARLSVEHDRWRAELFAQNILDENGIQDALAGFGFGSRPRPRVIGVKLGASF